MTIEVRRRWKFRVEDVDGHSELLQNPTTREDLEFTGTYPEADDFVEPYVDAWEDKNGWVARVTCESQGKV